VTKIRVAVPYRADGDHRDELWDWCRPRWEHPELELVEGFQHDDGPFNRARCINQALDGPWDAAVIADADTIISLPRLLAAVHWHLTPERLVLPYARRMLLTEDYTHRLLADAAPVPTEVGARALCAAEVERYGNFRSGVVVVHRELWNRVGGMDDRFVGWGGEDDAFADACEVLGSGPAQRLDGEVWHLWHPSSKPDRTDPLYKANLARYALYRRARKSPTAMQALINERVLG
jgi:hypothetical protein